eukprot:681717_1
MFFKFRLEIMSLLILLILQTVLFIGTYCVDHSQIVDGSNHFGYDLTNDLYQDLSSMSNLWISPFCITSCFALIYPGSNGKTQQEIASVMGYASDSVDPSDITQQFFTLQSSIEFTYGGQTRGSSIIGIANKIYASDSLTLKQSYIDALQPSSTQSFIDYNFDFSATNATTIINQWVNDNTNGLIHDIIPDGADVSLWRLVAMNAIYLNGSFELQFDTEMTSQHTFYSNALRTDPATQNADCHLMHQIDYFHYHSTDDHQFIKFPFTDMHDLFVLFALPKHSDLDDNGWITDASVISTTIDKLESTYVALALPKLSITATYALKEPLKDLGMTTAFDSRADFSGISDESLFIDTVIHKTMIEMDEKGLLAAAVTLIAMVRSVIVDPETPPTPILFKADHPFQMFIIDGAHDNAILFMGHINEPGIPEESETPEYDEAEDEIWNSYETEDIKDMDHAIRDMNSLIVVLCAVGVVLIGVLIWYWMTRSKDKMVYIEKQSTKNFVELKETKETKEKHLVSTPSIELGQGVTNAHADIVSNELR